MCIKHKRCCSMKIFEQLSEISWFTFDWLWNRTWFGMIAWSKDWAISEILNNANIPANPAAYLPMAPLPEVSKTNTIFEINSAKRYFPRVVTLAINDNIKFLENIKQGFKKKQFLGTNIYLKQKPKKPNLNYMIDPTFRNISRLFFHSKITIMILKKILLSIAYH